MSKRWDFNRQIQKKSAKALFASRQDRQDAFQSTPEGKHPFYTIRSNLPYTKGGYAAGPKSENAKKIAQCRANKKAKSQKNEDEI